METKIRQYLHQNCCRQSNPTLTQGFLIVDGEDGDELIYTSIDYDQADEHIYFDMKEDKKFDTYDELIKHIESLTL